MTQDKRPPIDFSNEELRDKPQAYRHTKPYTDFRYGVEKYSENKLKDIIYKHPGLQIFNMNIKGYGVQTDMAIKKGEIIEECVVAYETIEPGWEYLDGAMHARNQNVLASYRFAGPANSNDTTRGKHAQCWVIAFGNAAIFNHSEKPNIVWYHEPAQRLIVFMALRDIEAGEELCHCYTNQELTKKQLNDLMMNKHYHTHSMRQDPIDDKVRSSAAMEFEAPKDVEVNKPNDKDKVHTRAPEPVVPSATFKKYITEEVAGPKKIDTAAVDKVLSKEVNADWQPPNRGHKSSVTSKQFLDNYVPKNPSFEIEKDL